MRLDISMEELFGVPIDRVWHALTDPGMIERWLMRPDGYEAKVGARFTLRETPRADCRGQVECEVLELLSDFACGLSECLRGRDGHTSSLALCGLARHGLQLPNLVGSAAVRLSYQWWP
jgi:hypothetical protein